MRLRLSLSWLCSGAASERGARGIQSHPVQLHIVACAVGGVGCLPLRALIALRAPSARQRPGCEAPSEPRSGAASFFGERSEPSTNAKGGGSSETGAPGRAPQAKRSGRRSAPPPRPRRAPHRTGRGGRDPRAEGEEGRGRQPGGEGRGGAPPARKQRALCEAAKRQPRPETNYNIFGKLQKNVQHFWKTQKKCTPFAKNT